MPDDLARISAVCDDCLDRIDLARLDDPQGRVVLWQLAHDLLIHLRNQILFAQQEHRP
jgi:hypothetical protein